MGTLVAFDDARLPTPPTRFDPQGAFVADEDCLAWRAPVGRLAGKLAPAKCAALWPTDKLASATDPSGRYEVAVDSQGPGLRVVLRDVRADAALLDLSPYVGRPDGDVSSVLWHPRHASLLLANASGLTIIDAAARRVVLHVAPKAMAVMGFPSGVPDVRRMAWDHDVLWAVLDGEPLRTVLYRFRPATRRVEKLSPCGGNEAFSGVNPVNAGLYLDCSYFGHGGVDARAYVPADEGVTPSKNVVYSTFRELLEPPNPVFHLSENGDSLIDSSRAWGNEGSIVTLREGAALLASAEFSGSLVFAASPDHAHLVYCARSGAFASEPEQVTFEVKRREPQGWTPRRELPVGACPSTVQIAASGDTVLGVDEHHTLAWWDVGSGRTLLEDANVADARLSRAGDVVASIDAKKKVLRLRTRAGKLLLSRTTTSSLSLDDFDASGTTLYIRDSGTPLAIDLRSKTVTEVAADASRRAGKWRRGPCLVSMKGPTLVCKRDDGAEMALGSDVWLPESLQKVQDEAREEALLYRFEDDDLAEPPIASERIQQHFRIPGLFKRFLAGEPLPPRPPTVVRRALLR